MGTRWSILTTTSFYVGVCVLLFALCAATHAQQPKKIPRIGFISGSGISSTDAPSIKAFRQGLQELGYVERKNIFVEYRYLEGNLDRYKSILDELVELNVDVLVLTAAFRRAMQAVKNIPVVMLTLSDPVANGMVDSLSRPGGNITGLTRFARQLSGKRLELLKEILPTTSRIGVLLDGNSQAPVMLLKNTNVERLV